MKTAKMITKPRKRSESLISTEVKIEDDAKTGSTKFMMFFFVG